MQDDEKALSNRKVDYFDRHCNVAYLLYEACLIKKMLKNNHVLCCRKPPVIFIATLAFISTSRPLLYLMYYNWKLQRTF